MKIKYGECHCGCQQKTNIIGVNNYPRGLVKGQPYKYINGHTRRLLTPEYLVSETKKYKSSYCWIWQRCKTRDGYGHITISMSCEPTA